MKYAKIKDNTVIDVLTAITGFKIEDCFHPEILVGAVPVENDVQIGWMLNSDGTITEVVKTEEQIAAEAVAAQAAAQAADDARKEAEAALAEMQNRTQ